MPAPANQPVTSTAETPPTTTETSTETPTKSEIQDDVKWLEERLDKQDLTNAQILTELKALQTQHASTPELFSQKALTILEKIQESLSQRMTRRPSQTTTSQSTPPASQTTTTNQGAPDADAQTRDNHAAPDKSVLRFRRRAI